MVCRKKLSTGEELYILDDNTFICKEDFMLGKNSQGKELLLAIIRTPIYTIYIHSTDAIFTGF